MTSTSQGVFKKQSGLAKEEEDDTTCCGGSKGGADVKKNGGGEIMYGGVGTLIVRVVQARNLPAATGGGFFSTGSSNPFCVLEFEGQSHMTSVINQSLDPVWPREQFFFEVKMPAFHAESEEAASLKMAPAAGGKGGALGALSGGGFSSTEPHLHIRLVHRGTPPPSSGSRPSTPVTGDPTVFSKPGSGRPSLLGPGDRVLGEAFVNVVDLTTARRKALDGWFNLSNGGAVKLTVEYDVLDPVPQPGEMVRLLGFGASTDLWPLPLKEELRVEGYVDEHRERLLVSYRTSEGWKCTAEVHRFHVISAGRHRSILKDYQERALDAAIVFMETPLMAALGSALDRVEQEGIAAVSQDVWEGLKKGAARWYSLGLTTAVDDVKYAVGLKPDNDQDEATDKDGTRKGPGSVRVEGGAGEEDYVYDMLPSSLLDRILCPITGQPMKDPVVAADGHTYEREAIERWLTEHDTSPMTGGRLETPMVFRNHALASTIQELKAQNEALRAQCVPPEVMEGGARSAFDSTPRPHTDHTDTHTDDHRKMPALTDNAASKSVEVVRDAGTVEGKRTPPPSLAPLSPTPLSPVPMSAEAKPSYSFEDEEEEEEEEGEGKSPLELQTPVPMPPSQDKPHTHTQAQEEEGDEEEEEEEEDRAVDASPEGEGSVGMEEEEEEEEEDVVAEVLEGVLDSVVTQAHEPSPQEADQD